MPFSPDFDKIFKIGFLSIKSRYARRVGELAWCTNITAEGFMASYNASGSKLLSKLRGNKKINKSNIVCISLFLQVDAWRRC